MRKPVYLLIILLATLFSCGAISREPKAEVSWEKVIGLRLQAEGKVVPSAYNREKQGDTEGNKNITENILLLE